MWGASLILILGFFLALAPPAADAFVFSYGSGSGTDDHTKYISELVAAFKKDHPDATVELKGSNSYIKPILETLNSKFGEEAPDLGVVDLVAWPILHAKKLLRPMTSVFTARDLAKARSGLRPELNVQNYGRGLKDSEYALPFNRSFPVLYVNLKRVPGMKDRLVVSWDELRSILLGAPRSQGTQARLALPLEDWIGEYIMANARGSSSLAGSEANFRGPGVEATLKKVNGMVKAELIKLVDSQKVGFREFLNGDAAVALLSMSNYRSVVSRAAFPVQISMPPQGGTDALQMGGGDLVMPLNPERAFDKRTKRDIRAFITWFYKGRGAALWAKLTGYLPVTKKAAAGSLYAAELKARPADARVFRNEAGWKIHSFYSLADYCNIMQLRNFVRDTFHDAIASPDSGVVLQKADHIAGELLSKACP